MRISSLFMAVGGLIFGFHAVGALYVDGKKDFNGIYAYLEKPVGGPFKGDAGQQMFTFKEGVLTDGRYTPARSVGLPNRKNEKWRQRIYFDLGARSDISRINIISRVFPGKYKEKWYVRYCEIAVSENGSVFDVVKRGRAVERKQGKWEEYHFMYDTKSVPARYIRVDVFVPGWMNVQITEVDIFASKIQGNSSPDIETLKKIIAQQNTGPLVDRNGQFCRNDWPGKITSDKQLKDEYTSGMKNIPGFVMDSTTHDRFGGVKTLGIKRSPARKFRVEKINEKWWLITPDGYPFIMIAVDAMNLDQAVNTVIYPDKPEIRQRFTWLPERSDSIFKSCWKNEQDGIKRFDFAKANFIRIHGSDGIQDKFLIDAIKRIRYWGFNSLGKWTSPSTIERLQKLKLDIPFILVLNIKIDITKYNKVPDMFDPAFEPAVMEVLKKSSEKFADYPYYIGFTIANEAWWDHKGTSALLKAKNTAAKRVLVDMIMDKYQSLKSLNQVLGSSFKDRAELNNSDLNKYGKVLAPVVSSFIVKASEKYYSVWASARDKHDPGRLLMGSSFVVVGMWHVCEEWIRGSIQYSDIMMCDNHNLDPMAVYNDYIKPYVIPAGKPVMNGESSFCTTGYGFKYFKTNCESQKGRGEAYKLYNETLYALPEWLGTMYFVYRDQPIGGRNIDGGGESFNMGLVSNCHLPYQDFVDVVRKTNERLYDIHAGKTK